MRIAGIICEYNPFHNGHAKQLSVLRAAGFDRILCLMSGNLVQRGESAVFDRYIRAECALQAGADLVLELPFPYSSASAEYFSRAAIRILHRVGIHALSFGTESNDLEQLQMAAAITASDAFVQRLQKEAQISPHDGSATLYARVYQQMTGFPYPTGANDLLAIAYLRAIQLEGADFAAFPIHRVGTDYRAVTLTNGVAPSATALRQQLLSDPQKKIPTGFCPDSTMALLARAIANGMAPVDPIAFGDLLLPCLRLADHKQLASLAEASGGLSDRILNAAKDASNYMDLLHIVATKKYTDTRIRRASLFAVIGVTPEDLSSPPAYTRLLAANASGCELLSQRRKELTNFLVTKSADTPRTPAALRQTLLSDRADALYTLAMPQKQAADYFTRISPIIQK